MWAAENVFEETVNKQMKLIGLYSYLMSSNVWVKEVQLLLRYIIS
jgi:hypothetical protein